MKTFLSLNVTLVARILISIVLLLNALGIADQTIPAKQVAERGVPLGLILFMTFAGRAVEIVGSIALLLGVVPRLTSFALFAFLLPATFVSHCFRLAAGAPSFTGQLINLSKGAEIWGGFFFIAATSNRPGLLRTHHNG